MSNTVNIRILDKEYQVDCPVEEQGALLRSSQLLDTRMREIRKSGHVIGLERIAIMAALNLTYDLLLAESNSNENLHVDKELQRLDKKLDSALQRLAQPEL